MVLFFIFSGVQSSCFQLINVVNRYSCQFANKEKFLRKKIFCEQEPLNACSCSRGKSDAYCKSKRLLTYYISEKIAYLKFIWGISSCLQKEDTLWNQSLNFNSWKKIRYLLSAEKKYFLCQQCFSANLPSRNDYWTHSICQLRGLTLADTIGCKYHCKFYTCNVKFQIIFHFVESDAFCPSKYSFPLIINKIERISYGS